jgi:hypothetical protein
MRLIRRRPCGGRSCLPRRRYRSARSTPSLHLKVVTRSCQGLKCSQSVFSSRICAESMERLWSLAVATSGNRWQIGRLRKRRNQAKTVATGCDQLPRDLDGKEGVDGSSPSEGSAKLLQIGTFLISSICVISSMHQVCSPCGVAIATAALRRPAAATLCLRVPANTVDFAIALREPGQPLRIEHDHHLFAVFPDASWRRLIDDPDADEHVLFVGRRPAGREIRRQIEAG